MSKNASETAKVETAVKAEKKNIENMNLAELRKERHHIAAKISNKKKTGKDATELLAQEKTIVTMIANMAAREKATKDAEKQVARAEAAAKKADEKAAKKAAAKAAEEKLTYTNPAPVGESAPEPTAE